jgi:hypothetical protein
MWKDYIIAFLSSRWSKNIYGASNSEPGWRSYAPGKMLCCQKIRLSELSGSLKKPARVPGVIPTLGVQTKVGSSNPQKFLAEVRTFDIPNLKPCSDLAFWILIQTILNSWKTWKISLGVVSYWDKTTSLYIYERIMADWVSIYPIVKNTTYQLLLP